MKKHNISSIEELSEKSRNNLEWFWESVEKDIGIVWDVPYTKTLDTSNGIPWTKWFVEGKTNLYKSSVEKFTKQTPEKIAYNFISEDGIETKLSYSELNTKVSKLANGFKSLGVKKGDVIAIYLPMIEEAIISILAAAKIGAVQTIVFSGYSSESLKTRLQDCHAKILLTSDGFHRKGKAISQKTTVDNAVIDTDIEKIIVVPYKGIDKFEKSDKIQFYDELIPVSGTLGIEWSKKLAQSEGIFTGISGGSSFAVAIKVAENAKPGSTILCMLPDTGERYLSSPLFDEIEESMSEGETELSNSTPSYQMPAT